MLVYYQLVLFMLIATLSQHASGILPFECVPFVSCLSFYLQSTKLLTRGIGHQVGLVLQNSYKIIG